MDFTSLFVLLQICEIKLSPMPSFSHQGTVKISLVHNKKKEAEVYKVPEVPDMKKTNAEANGSSGAGGGAGTGGGGSNGGGCMGRGTSCDDGIIININSGRSITGDIKVEYYAKQHLIGKKKLFSFWFNSYFVCEKRDDGTYTNYICSSILFSSTFFGNSVSWFYFHFITVIVAVLMQVCRNGN